MSKTILITGLDGCGKSTVFSRLKNENNDAFALITLPFIDTSGIIESQLLSLCSELNKMNSYADLNQLKDLKALALFSSMLLFPQLVNAKTKENTKYIICERHPLIDADVYAAFYASHLNPDKMNQEIMIDYQSRYKESLNYFASLLPSNYQNENSVYSLFKYIYKNYKVNKKKDNVFKELTFPDEIYFLKADPEILYSRISSREVKEPHETIGILRKLITKYEKVLSETKNKNVTINIIDASDFNKLDAFYKTLLTSEISL